MLVTPLTITIDLIAIACLVIVLRRWSAGRMQWQTTLLWAGLWMAIAIFALFAGLIDALLPLAHMQERLFFALVGGVVLLFILMFSVFGRLDRLQQAQSHMISQIAIREYRMRYGWEPSRKSSADTQN